MGETGTNEDEEDELETWFEHLECGSWYSRAASASGIAVEDVYGGRS